MRRLKALAVAADSAAKKIDQSRSTARRAVLSLALAAVIGSMAVAVAVAAAPPSTAGGTQPPGTAAGAPTVVKVERVAPPRRKVLRSRFRPWARPSPRKVREIIRLEARRSHIDPSRLARRVGCESHFQWSAGNGSYQGLLQFASSTFSRGLSSIKSRRVMLVRTHVHRVHETKIVHYSDGHVVRKRGRKHRQRVVHVYRGTLPRRPELTHAWTQLRIGSQSIRGVSAVNSSEWSCPA